MKANEFLPQLNKYAIIIGTYMGGRLVSRKGGDACGGIPSNQHDVHVWHVHSSFAELPKQKEIGRPL